MMREKPIESNQQLPVSETLEKKIELLDGVITATSIPFEEGLTEYLVNNDAFRAN
jgi:hypothetical protein